MLYKITDGTLAAGGSEVLRHFSFEISGSRKAALLGPNGCGKTTLLRFINGEIELERDDRRRTPPLVTDGPIRISMLHQQPPSGGGRTVREEIRRLSPSQDPDSREYRTFAAHYAAYFTGMGFAPDELDRKMDEFSGGQRMRIELIRLMLENPDLMLLDEPTNHLDLQGIEYLEHFLHRFRGAAVIVSHDRYFLDQTVQMIYEFSGKKLVRYMGGYTEYRQQKQERIRRQVRQYTRIQAERERLEQVAARFKGRSSKDSFAKAKLKQAARLPEAEKPDPAEMPVRMDEIAPAVPGPKNVLECEKLVIGYDRPLAQVTFRLRRGSRLGVIGANGTGKTALLRTVTGQIPPLSGKYRLGMKVQIGYFDQKSADIHSPLSVREHFGRHFPEMREEDVRRYLAGYRFRGADTARKVDDLSGGEKARLVLAEMLHEGPNLLILDEPTNHLDIMTREVLETALSAYTGTMIIVSHDRYFISKMAQCLLVFEKGKAYFYPFDYHFYCSRRRAAEKYGDDALLRVQAENQALVDGLRSVPEKSSLLGGHVSDEKLYEEWRLEPAKEAMEAAAAALEKVSREWTEKREKERMQALRQFAETGEETGMLQETDSSAMRAAEDRYHKTCLDWFDVWSELHPQA